METDALTRSRAAGLLAAGASDAGRVRAHNEDRFICEAERGLFAVIDGVGGANAGEVAAEIARHVIRERLARPEGAAEERLREAVALANNEIYHRAQASAEHTGMACVLTVVLVEGHRLTAAHVGDTRLYLIHEGAIRKLTPDHSPVGMQEDAGALTEAQAMGHPRRNEIYRDAGSSERDPYEPDFIEIVRSPFPPDAALLLCSDGLSDLVPSDELLRTVVETAGHPDEAVRALIQRANAAGGKDNITVVVAQGAAFAEEAFAEEQVPPPPPPTRPQPAPPNPPSEVPAPQSRWLGRGVAFVLGVLAGLLVLTVAQRLLDDRVGPARTPERLRVDAAGGGEGAYPTLAEALAAAQPGDVVEVAPGDYAAGVAVPPGVGLVAQTPGTVRLTAPGAEAALRVGAGSRVSGVRVAADSAAGAPFAQGIVAVGADVVLDEVEVGGAAGAGIVFAPEASGVLRASRIYGSGGAGVVLSEGAVVRLTHNIIEASGRADAAAPGVRISPSAAPVLEGNVFRANPGGAVTAASRTAALATRNLILP